MTLWFEIILISDLYENRPLYRMYLVNESLDLGPSKILIDGTLPQIQSPGSSLAGAA